VLGLFGDFDRPVQAVPGPVEVPWRLCALRLFCVRSKFRLFTLRVDLPEAAHQPLTIGDDPVLCLVSHFDTLPEDFLEWLALRVGCAPTVVDRRFSATHTRSPVTQSD
jgi:hypothetical protein